MFLIKTLISFLKDKEYQSLLLTTGIVLAIGSTVYHNLEGWSWLDSLYFSVITLTTVGYGDFSPQTDAGKIFTMIYIVVGLGIVLSFVETVHNHYDTMKSENKK